LDLRHIIATKSTLPPAQIGYCADGRHDDHAREHGSLGSREIDEVPVSAS
jgi:hypothetical protein